MHYFAPERKRLGGSGAPLLEGAPWSIVPKLSVDPCEDGSWTITTFVPTDTGWSARATATTLIGVTNVLSMYVTDPEVTLKELFEWEVPSARPQGPSQAQPAAIDTSELDLDDLLE